MLKCDRVNIIEPYFTVVRLDFQEVVTGRLHAVF